MNKVMVLLKAILVVLLLTSCASNGTTVPKAFPGSDEIFQVNGIGTVEVKGYNLKYQPTHWAFVGCDYWTGCYMRCQGPKKLCKSIAEKSGLKVINMLTNH